MKRLLAGLIAAAFAAGAAPAIAGAPTDIVNRHTSSGGDLDKLMADYADDAVVLQAGRAVQGKAAIREMFARMFAPRPAPAAAPAGAPPAGSAPGGGMGGMKVTRVWEEGNVGFMTWEAGPMKATEEFLVNKDGKIAVQTIFMSGPPMGPRPAVQ